MLQKIIFYIFIVITIDAMTYMYSNKKYRGHIDLKHYFIVLKMPMYQKSLLFKIIIAQVLLIISMTFTK